MNKQQREAVTDTLSLFMMLSVAFLMFIGTNDMYMYVSMQIGFIFWAAGRITFIICK